MNTPTRESLIESKKLLVPIRGDGHCAIYAAFLAWLLGPNVACWQGHPETFAIPIEVAKEIRKTLDLGGGYLDGYEISMILAALESIHPLHAKVATSGGGIFFNGDRNITPKLAITFTAPSEGATGNHWDIAKYEPDHPPPALDCNLDSTENYLSLRDVIIQYVSKNRDSLVQATIDFAGADITDRIDAIIASEK